MKWTPTDIIALVLILGCFVSILSGHNHYLLYLLCSVASSYGLVKIAPGKLRRK